MSIQVGRVVLNEAVLRAFEESWSVDGNSVSLSGILFSSQTLPRARLVAMHDDILGLPTSLVPVLLDTKSSRNGYYKVVGSGAGLTEIGDQGFAQVVWKIDLQKLGNDTQVDLESRLAGPVNRLNDFTLAGERWHAPAKAHQGYWADNASPGQVTRTGTDGPIVVYRQIPYNSNPRWYCPVESYALGRVRLTESGNERAGANLDLGVSGWSISNSLMSFALNPAGGFHTRVAGGLPKDWNIQAPTQLGPPVAVSMIYNEYERITIRVLWNRGTGGRVQGDVTLRRGSRFVEIVLKSNVSGTIGISRAVAEAGTSGSGFVRATSNDAEGHRYILGSLRTFTGDLVGGGISVASSTRLDAIVGAEVGGSAAVAGDQAAQVMAQYVGVPSEVVQGVKR